MERKIGRIEPAKFKSKPKAAAKPSPSTKSASPCNEDEWRARDDARTLAQAAAIKSDPDRLKKAIPEARKMLEEKTAEVRGLRAISRRAK